MAPRPPSGIARIAILVAAVTPALTAAGARAQVAAGPRLEVGAFGTFSRYDAATLASRAGAGGRLGFFPVSGLSVEANGDFTRTETGGWRVDVTRVGATVAGHLRLARWNAVYLGAGYDRIHYRGAVSGEDNGAHLVLGNRTALGGGVVLRIEGRAGYVPNARVSPTGDRALNVTAAVGLSLVAFGGPPRDADGDLVPDKRDRCPDTPAGARVGEDGCPLDGDADGVADGLDRCPDTPAGALVDGSGCPRDADGDGTLDGIDVCPDTPLGATTDSNGCPTDEDGDGVWDGLDRCPGTPSSVVVDAEGCPLDSDTDGVPDGRDRCDRTPPGTEVDEVGCPVLFREERGRTQPLVLRGVTFEVGSARLTSASHAALDEVAKSLLAHPEVRVEVSGHTDATGPRSLNMRLSLARAQAVAAYLASRGVAHSRMEARGYGPDRPVAGNRTAAGRALNRRVELHRIDGTPGGRPR